ncbi:MAG: hypothetical protein PHP08_00905 [Candidatus Dojkabacteria bacterium]|nr:hypothetical protein [Candidatus Dojkabacteria bacterium]
MTSIYEVREHAELVFKVKELGAYNGLSTHALSCDQLREKIENLRRRNKIIYRG